MTARTPEASTVHEPFGKPGGPGLFHVKGLQLPAYIQHIAHRLVANGKTESEAIQMAIGIVKNWSEGKGGVHPDVRAAAARAVAEWEAAKAKAHTVGGGLTSGNRRVTSVARRDEAVELAGEQRYRHGWIKIGGAVETPHGSGRVVGTPSAANGDKVRVKLDTPPGKKTGDALVSVHASNVHAGTGAKARARADRVETRSVSAAELKAGKLDPAKMGPAERAFHAAQRAQTRRKPRGTNLSREVELNNWANWDANKGGSQQAKDSAGHDAGTKAAIASAYKNKANADAKTAGKKAAAAAKSQASKRAAAAKKQANANTAAKKKAQTVANALGAAALRQAQADQKAGRALTPQQKKRLADASAAAAAKAAQLRNLSAEGQEAIELAVPKNLRANARAAAAKRGKALPDGSFPIRNRAELVKAKRAVGRANPEKRGRVKAFIQKRAAALGVGRGKA